MPSQPPQPSQPPPPPPEQRWEYVDGMYRCVVASAINFIKVWQASSEQQTVLELPPAIDAVERARVAAFAESLGLAHETVDTFDGVMLRIAPAAAAAEAAPPEAAPPAAEAAAQAHTQATAQARTQTAAPTRPPPPLSELTEGQSERMAASQAAAVARRAAATAAAAAETTEAAAVVATEAAAGEEGVPSASLPASAPSDQAILTLAILTLSYYIRSYTTIPATISATIPTTIPTSRIPTCELAVDPDRTQRRREHDGAARAL